MAKRHNDWRAVIKDAVARVDEEKTLHKQDRSRQRRAEILAAALRVFAREGIARARINDIASEAGVPSASIYDYFETKEELAYAVPIHQQTDFSPPRLVIKMNEVKSLEKTCALCKPASRKWNAGPFRQSSRWGEQPVPP